MKVEQKLSSGIHIRQDFRNSVRFIMFETDIEQWMYATHGGTAFIVNLKGKLFGITCRHVLGDFNWRQIALTDTKFGRNIAGLSSICYPSEPKEAAEGSDILDVAIVQFSNDVNASFFNDSSYVFDDNSIATSSDGDELLVNGALKDESAIDDTTITAKFALLEFNDNGHSDVDPVLREGIAKFRDPEFDRLTGISGSPVFNKTKGKLCGMVVRGGMNGDDASIKYIDIFDIKEILSAIVEERSSTQYAKTISHPTVAK